LQTRNYGKIDDYNDSSIKLLATKLAQLHTLELPIHKDDTKPWHDEVFGNFLTEKFFDEMIKVKLVEDMKNAKIDTFSVSGLLKEVKLIEEAIKNVKSPLVMAHQDFNRGNILVLEECGEKGITNPPRSNLLDIKFLDLDYSGYMYRGLDLGKYISEWRADHIPLIAILDQLPSNQDMDVFLSAYRTECGKQFGAEWMENELNSIEKLRQETCVFALHAHLQDIAFCLYIASEEKDKEKRKEFLVS
jgi:thiamine kinase-like enzyme